MSFRPLSFRAQRRNLILAAAAILLLAWFFCLPRHLFKGVTYSTVVESAEGELLGARIAADQQWRFPPCDTVPERLATALIQFEDRHFRYHPGVNPFSLVRAVRDNIRHGHVVSGGSTISMQVIRLSRQKERTLRQKMIEALLGDTSDGRHPNSVGGNPQPSRCCQTLHPPCIWDEGGKNSCRNATVCC